MSASGDYISREAAIVASIYTSPMMPSQWLPIQHAIEAIPAADVLAVRRGKWMEDWETGCSECSACHDTFLWEDYNGVAEWNFCPNCGADMREES